MPRSAIGQAATHCQSATLELKAGTKKAAPIGAAFFAEEEMKGVNTTDITVFRLKIEFYLASSYFLRGLPPKYRHRCCVSQPSSRWIGVVPHRYGHQDSSTFSWVMNPENCIGSADVSIYTSELNKVCLSGKNQRSWSSPRSISTPPLHPLLDFHVEPINGCSSRDLTGLPHGNTHLEVGFPLRCFQRLSTPHMATQRLPLAR